MSIQEEVERINQAKLDIKEAIRDKGVQVSDDELISDYAGKVSAISGGGGIEDKEFLEIIYDDNKTEMGQQATYSATPYSICLDIPGGYSYSSWSFPLQADGSYYPMDFTYGSSSASYYSNPRDLGDFATAQGKKVDLVINGITCPVYMPYVIDDIWSLISGDGKNSLADGFLAAIAHGVVDFDFDNAVAETNTRTYQAYADTSTASPTGTVTGTVYRVPTHFRSNTLTALDTGEDTWTHFINIGGLETLAAGNNGSKSNSSIHNVSDATKLIAYFFGYMDSGTSRAIDVLVPTGHTLNDVKEELRLKNGEISQGEIYFIQPLYRDINKRVPLAAPSIFATALAKAKEDGYAILDGDNVSSPFNLSFKTISSSLAHLSDFVNNSKLLTFNYTNDDEGIFDEPHTALLMTNDDLDLSGIDSVTNSRW